MCHTKVTQNPLKTLNTFGNCQRPVFSLGVSQHLQKITNVWTFEFNWSSKLRLKSAEFSNSIQVCYFRGSRFSQYSILSTAPRCSLSELSTNCCHILTVDKLNFLPFYFGTICANANLISLPMTIQNSVTSVLVFHSCSFLTN